MGALYLVPVDEESYRATLAHEIDLSGWTERPTGFPATARVCGVRTDPERGTWERNKRTWAQMEPGEPLLFYRNGEGRFFASGRIGTMAKTDYVRNKFCDGGPADSVYEVKEYDEQVRLSLDRVNMILGYSDGFVPQGTHQAGEDRPADQVLSLV